ncbi:MAG: hypothetical protein LBF32_04345, partial [Streptococcaceae bacterium]|nr:hypothetical protein [Streptococcaceae bacterium]
MRLKKQKILAGLLLSGTLLSVVMASQAKAVDTEVSVQFEDDTNVVHYAKDPDKREVDDANKPNADANGA